MQPVRGAPPLSRILVVEDDARLGRQVRDRLTAAGYETTWVASGEDALGVSGQRFGLIILDVRLPGISGLALLQQLRERENSTPVLVMSACNETRDRLRAMELGAADYLTKPFWPEELLARVAARLGPGHQA